MTTNPAPFGPMMTAMITPMHPDGTVDFDGAARLADYLVTDMRNDGLVVNGTTGEAPTTTDDEKERLLQVVLETIGARAAVVAGVGTNETEHTIELARSAERVGVHGLLVVTPYYNKPPQPALEAHFTAVADATGLPVLIYDIPGRTGAAVATDTLVRLAAHPRIVGVKDAKDDPSATSHVLARTDLVYYCGTDMLNLPWLSLGAVGFVSVVGHVAGDRLHEMIDAFTSGDVARARQLHFELIPLYDGLFRNQGGDVQGGARPARPAGRRGARTAARGHRGGKTPARARPRRGRRQAVSHPHPDLALPAPLAKNGLRIVALGGLGEIGRNMTVFEYRGRLLIVDCGVLFPDSDQPGVDLILPDFGYLEGRLDQIEALVLTHAHEDHIGGVPYLLRQRKNIPLVGSRLTLALVQSKLAEHRLDPDTVEVVEGSHSSFGPFDCEFFAVNHSIPDALAVAIRTPAGVVLHTGDFKMDQLPLDGRLTDLAGFARLGTDGVDLLMADSTNAEVPGVVTSERDIAPVLDEIFGHTRQRIIVACFASHVHRVQQVLNAAVKHRRKVAFVGRSMVRNMGVARDLGYLRVPGGLLVELREAEELPPGDVVLISTGSQGEPMSALSRMAGRDHPIRIAAGDTVILASSLIPGNETAVYRVINGLTRLGARVVHKQSALVHVSGHAPAGELLYVLNLVRPRNFMPIHGEWRHLRAHAHLAALTGVPDNNIVIADDGVVVDLVGGQASVAGAVPCGYVYVDGLTVGEVTESQLKDRRILGDEGFISIVIVVDANSGKMVAGPEIQARGSGIDDAAFGEVLPRIEEALVLAAADGITDAHQISQLARRIVGKWVSDNYRRRPMIIPVVIEA